MAADKMVPFVLRGGAGDDPDASCVADTFQGSVTLISNQGGLELGGDTIAGRVLVTGTTRSGPDWSGR